MKPVELLYQVNQRGMVLWVEQQDGADDKLKFSLRQMLPDKEQWLLQIKLHKAAIIEVLKAAKVHSEHVQLPLIYPTGEQSSVLSFAQKRLWFLQQFEPQSAAYNVPLVLEFQPEPTEFSADCAKAALQAVMQRHQVLRTLLRRCGTEVTAQVQSADLLEFQQLELEAGADEEQRHQLLRQQLSTAFLLDQQLPIRCCLVQQPGHRLLLLLTLHHIAVDGWSLPCLLHEFEQFYHHLRQHRPLHLAELPIQYQDFAYWQQLLLQGELQQEQWRYWQQQLADAQPLELPLDRNRPARFDARGATEQLHLDAKSMEALQQLARSLGCSFYVLTLAAYFMLLHKYCQQNDLLVGTAAANRHYPGTGDLIGFFVNSLPIRCQTQPAMRLTELILQVQQQLNLAQQHQDLPFDLLVEKLQLPRDPSCHPLFQVFFALQQADEPKPDSCFVLQTPPGLYQVAKYDLSLFVSQSSQGLQLELNYATAVFDQATVAQMLAHYRTLLLQLLANPQQSLSQLQLLDAQQQYHLVMELNQTVQPLPAVSAITDLFCQQARQTPQAIALRFNGESLSYQQLDQRSTELALLIQPQLVRSDDKLVALLMQRSLELIVAIIAIHKAGGAYVPIAEEFPPERQDFILKDTQAALLLSHQPLQHKVQALSVPVPVLWADNLQWQVSSPCHAEPPCSIQHLPEAILFGQLAYVIYTSGTTGQPKGVMLEHGHLLNRIDWMQRSYPLTAADKVLQKTPYMFDVSVWELVWATAYGAQIVLAKPEGHKDPAYLYQLIIAEQITVIHFVPTMFQAFLDHLSRCDLLIPDCLRFIFCSGEALSAASVQLFFQLNPSQSTQLHNLYGPTETAIDSSFYHCASAQSTVPIGKPIQNTQLYILDTELQLVPKGVAAELYIAGAGVARGYLNRPELSAERFLPNPFYHAHTNPDAGTRMYKTGDRVKMLPDGNIEYLGRNDFQVKLHGFRIELAEIEAALCALPQISQALVMVQQPAEHQLLVAYCQSDALPEPALLRELLLQKLPSYMVPEHFIALPRFPVNVNGKLDRKALPLPELKGDSYVAPETPEQQQLVALWQQYLKLERVGIEDDFFRLGGNSILAISLSHAMAELLGCSYPVSALFADKTIARALHNTRQKTQQARLQIQPCPLQQPALSFAQQRLWFLHHYDTSASPYNIPIVLDVHHASTAELEQGLQLVLQRHSILRSVIVPTDELPRLQLRPATELRIEQRWLDDSEFAAELQSAAHYRFDLQQQIPVKAWCFELSSQRKVLVMTIHHSAFDGWSHGLLLQELEQAMHHVCSGQTLQLAPLPLQYQDYAHWQRQAFAQGQFDHQLQYWQQQLHQFSPLQLPLDFSRPASLSYQGDNLLFRFPQALTQSLKQLASAQGCSLYSLMLSGFAVLLSKYSGQQDIVLGTPFANRHHANTEQLIGFFVNTLPLRLQLQPHQQWQHWLEQVNHQVHQAQLHQDLPFEYLVEQLKLVPDPSRHPVFQLLFSMDQFTEPGRSDFFSAVDLGDSYQVAKYDLSLFMKDEGQQLLGALNFSSALFSRDSMQRLSERYLALMQHIAAEPACPLDQLQWWSNADKHSFALNTKPDHTTTSNSCFAPLFAQQVARTPERIALVWRGQSWTYQQLDQQSNQLAWSLKQLGCNTSDKVALLLPRGPQLILSILAVLKLGAAYVPISPDYPLQRIRFILGDTAARVLLTDQSEAFGDVRLCNPADPAHLQQPVTALPFHACSTDLAYVIYTSGTTGQPKGVMIEQHSFTDFLLNFPLDLCPDEPAASAGSAASSIQLVSLTSVTFDIFGLEYGVPLLRGGILYLSDVPHLAEDLKRYPGINLLQQTPSVLRSLLAMQDIDFSAITCLVGGEALPAELLQQLLQRFAKVINLYGPTETVIWSTSHSYGKDSTAPQPLIGKALPHEFTYVLDPELRPLPAGVVGELYIGGAGLARGYLNQPELTAERFILHPQTAERLYKTGDLVRLRLDNTLEYKGRLDFQVKIRGHRIELAEIEQVLRQHPQIVEAVVIAADQTEPYLVAYYQATEPVAEQQLKDCLAAALPDYMWPEFYVQVEAFSLTANGKLDRAALPTVKRQSRPQPLYKAAVTALEKTVVAIWQQVLQLDQVSLADDFFQLGGNSIKAMLLCHQMAKQADWPLAVADVFQHRSIEQLLAQRQAKQQQNGPVASDQSRAPLSLSQNRLWFLYTLDPASTAYHIPMLLELKQPNLPRLEQALRDLLQHQQVLCSLIEELDGKAWQYQVSVDYFQLRQQQIPAEALASAVQKAAAQPFVLEAELPIRANVFQTEDGRCYLLLLLHHIAFDGWSMDLLFQQLDLLYHQQKTLPELAYQYRDYARWQQQQPRHTDPRWQHLSSIEPLDLRPCYTRPKVFDYRGAELSFNLSPLLSEQLQHLARQQQVSLYQLLLAVWSLTLHKLTGQQNIVLGSPMANRQLPGSDALIGFFVNTQLLCHQVSPEQDFLSLLSQVATQSTQAQRYQHLPFEMLLEQLTVTRDTSRHPLFQIMFSLQTFAEHAEQLQWLSPVAFPASACTAKYDLSFQLELRDNQISGVLNYASSLFSKARIELIQQGFINLLEQVVAAPQRQNSQLSLLSAKEQSAMLQLAEQRCGKEAISTSSLNALFAVQVAAHPSRVAVELDQQQLSYAELDALSSQLAHLLLEQGGEQQQLIALLMPRSIWMIVAILAVLKTGSAWVPIEPSVPQQRLNHMLQDTQARLLLSVSEYQGRLQLPDHCRMLCLDQLDVQHKARTAPGIVLSARDLAYVIYTSGTTGQPKAVLIEHQAVVNTLLQQQKTYQIGPDSALYLGLSYAFDAAVAVIMNALLSGARLVLSNDIDFHHPRMATISHLILSGAVLDLLQPESLPSLQYLIYGGAAASPAALQRFQHLQIYAEYGVTEAAITSSLSRVMPAQAPGIGSALANVSLYVLDEQLQPVPFEVTGQLYIGGVGLARGYLNQPELQAQSFIPHPFRPGERLYKTGDLVRWQYNANQQPELVFEGRKDRQLKLRGYRIEPGEIEQQLLSHPQVKQLALKLQPMHGRDQLVAYLVTSASDFSALVSELSPLLADFMQPDHWMQLQALPYTVNGKLDENALPLPSLQTLYVSPDTETEQRLALLWQQLLGNIRPGRQDDFFQLGGDSILVMQLAALLKKAGWTVQVSALMQHRSLKAMALLLDQQDAQLYQAEQAEQGVLTGQFALLPIQHWFFDQVNAQVVLNRDYWNQSFLIKVQPLQLDLLLKAAQQLVMQHDMLRVRFVRSAEGYQQCYLAEQPVQSIRQLNVAGLTEAELELQLSQWQSQFDVQQGPLFSLAYLYNYPDGSARIFVACHHLLMDAVSWRLVVEDLKTCYQQQALPEKTSSYRQWVQAQHTLYPEYPASYWQALCHSVPKLQVAALCSTSTAQRHLSVQQSSQLLQQAHFAYQTEINELLLSALALALRDLWGGDTQAAMLESHGRQTAGSGLNLNRTLGWFTSFYPVLLSAGEDLPNSIAYNKDKVRRAASYGQSYIASGCYQTETPKQWVNFNYLGQINALAHSSEAADDWQIVAESSGANAPLQQGAVEGISILAVHQDQQFRFSVTTQYGQGFTDQLAQAFAQRLQQVLQHCLQQQTVAIPSLCDYADFTPYQLHQPGQRQTLVLFPPGEGDSIDFYQPLLERLPDTRVVLLNNFYRYASQHQSDKAGLYSFSLLAEQLLPLLDHLNPGGDWHFIGWSFGGVLALEVCRLLEQRQQQIASVQLIDSYFSLDKARLLSAPLDHALSQLDLSQDINARHQCLSKVQTEVRLYKANSVSAQPLNEPLKLLETAYLQTPDNFITDFARHVEVISFNAGHFDPLTEPLVEALRLRLKR